MPSEHPNLEQLMRLGSIAPKSEEEGKPTFNIALTAKEMQALAVLSNGRFAALMDVPGEDAGRMCGIYLGITSKLMLGLLQAGLTPMKEDDNAESTGSGVRRSENEEGSG